MNNLIEKEKPIFFPLFYRRKERQNEKLTELTRKMVKKLMAGISDGGTVSFFHNKTTGDFETAIFTGYFTSSKIPRLWVTIWKKDLKPSEESLEFQRRLFGMTHSRIRIEAIEQPPGQFGGRAIGVVQRWDMGPDDWDIVYRRSADKEGGNTAIPRSIGEKMKFLRDILETTVDTAANEESFGRPYVKGDSLSNNRPDDTTIHRKQWVRDIKDTALLPLLPMS